MWLVEIYLNMLSHHGANKKHVDENDEEAAEDAFNDQTSRELLSLMRQPKVSECIANNRNTFYDLLSCHGDKVRSVSVDEHYIFQIYNLQATLNSVSILTSNTADAV